MIVAVKASVHLWRRRDCQILKEICPCDLTRPPLRERREAALQSLGIIR